MLERIVNMTCKVPMSISVNNSWNKYELDCALHLWVYDLSRKLQDQPFQNKITTWIECVYQRICFFILIVWRCPWRVNMIVTISSRWIFLSLHLQQQLCIIKFTSKSDPKSDKVMYEFKTLWSRMKLGSVDTRQQLLKIS